MEIMNINIGSYTKEEHSVYIGKVSKFRRLINKGLSSKEAGKICAREIISDETGPGDVLERRYKNTKDPVDSFGQHVERIDEVCAGVANDCIESEEPFNGILPY
ncbi:hypothetical protein GC096_30710 [Paenibacillus sp. LMG 31461]|uniref:Uncharacterized protein n=1 Tax=Paenibacillus plantarum TaxID=2654975 RepID=A0ABX1XIX1_9BACL|nr:hypothetical protein [Paenibacillus plantarum]NOU68402.1 hypothetical protein [Paenibacillus plantarum]